MDETSYPFCTEQVHGRHKVATDDCGDPPEQDRGSQEHWELMEGRSALDWLVSEVKLWQQDGWDPRSQNPHGDDGGRWLEQLQAQDLGSPQGVEELEPVLLKNAIAWTDSTMEAVLGRLVERISE